MNTITYLRSFRIFDVAMFDYIASIIGFYIIFRIFKIEHSLTNYLSIVPIAIISHVLVNQETVLNKNLFNNEVNGYKIFVLFIIFYIFLTRYN